MTSEPVTRDGFLNKKIWLLQPENGYRVAIDPVFLAASIPLRPHQRVLDCGCGVGAITNFLLSRDPTLRATGVEKNSFILQLAVENHISNGFPQAFEPVHADMALLDLETTFDHVLSNPPFYAKNSYQTGPFALKSEANQETVSLDQWVLRMLRHLKDKGHLTLILPPERMADIFLTAIRELGDLKIFPLWQGGAKPAKRVLIQGQKGTKGPLQVLPGLVLHGENKAYTQEANAILRGGEMDWGA